MTIQVITDSTADIPAEIIEKLNIKIVPIYVRFGDKTYRDGLDIKSEEFYSMLESSPVHPATSQPNPEDFVDIYRQYTESHEAIISIHVSSKLSGTHNSAIVAKKSLGGKIPLEVVDSKFTSFGLGAVTIAAARLAQSGADMHMILDEVHLAIDQMRMFGMFEHMKYLARSGRVSKAIASASNLLNVMPLLTFHDGELARAGFVRKVEKGMDRIYDYVKNNLPISELAIVHSNVLERAELLRKRCADFIDREKITITELGSSLGVHGGPGVLLIAARHSG
ncbi:MAG: DegV family protein [Dehalococcoidales bacterium]|nr:MAG: DegV family protein [Dehalococcoidales bacterium]